MHDRHRTEQSRSSIICTFRVRRLRALAAVIGSALFASATPSPLYETYSRLWDFSPLFLTLVYATYAVEVLAALLLAGRASDDAGRRPVLLLAISALLIASVVYMLAQSVAWLFVARGVQASRPVWSSGPRAPAAPSPPTSRSRKCGLDQRRRQRRRHRPRSPGLLRARATPPRPTCSPTCLCSSSAITLRRSPADAGAGGRPVPAAALPQRPQIPDSVRQPFLVAALAVTSAYSIGGLFLALGPQLSGQIFETGNHLVTGSDLSPRRLRLAGPTGLRATSAWLGVVLGSVALAAGVLLIVLAAVEERRRRF